LGAIIADDLGVDGTLSSLHRIHEGQFYYDDEVALNPFEHLALPNNIYLGDEEYLELGRKLSLEYFETQADGVYLIETTNFFSIIEYIIMNWKFDVIPHFSFNLFMMQN